MSPVFPNHNRFLLEVPGTLVHLQFRQGPWNADLRTPPGPEGSNGSLLCICRGHPGIFILVRCRWIPTDRRGGEVSADYRRPEAFE